ncbi:hypothetical protein BGZ49_003942 [Haplosporangium sp. Z 27]|nr:hypothetical protein BGZ49_003942 [Haplosporangium sp. Z 27]
MSAATTSSLESLGHPSFASGNARTRTKSMNLELSQLQYQSQQQTSSIESSQSSTVTFNQITSDLLNQHNGLHSSHHHDTSLPSSKRLPSTTSTTTVVANGDSLGNCASADPHPYSLQQDALLAMQNNSNHASTFGKAGFCSNTNIEGSGNNMNHYSNSSIYNNSSASHIGSNPNIALANSNSSLSTLTSNSPLQHRPNTPLKSSFPISISEYPSDTFTAAPSSSPSSNIQLGDERDPSAPSSSRGSFEAITTAPSQSFFRSFSTKAGRNHFSNNENHVGTLPTIHHPNDRARHEGFTVLGISMKHLSLIVLLLQNSVLVLMMRYSRVSVDPDQPMYLASTAVFIAEIIKLCTCSLILLFKTGSIHHTVHIIRKEILEQPREILKMVVPSALYALQNNLLYIALSNLEAATFQVTYQMKILSTAIFSVVMLNRRLTRQKWLSLCLLMVGVTLVQLQNVGTGKSPVIIDNSRDEDGEPELIEFTENDGMSETTNHLNGGSGEEESSLGQNPIIGLLAVLISCVSSGFAGCYFEKILKGSESDMWVRNLQLGISGSLFSFFAMFYDRHKIYEGGIFQGYSTITWVVITNQALGGLLVAIVVKYADNILKGFATSLSIIISGMISVYFFDFEPSIQFQLGTLVVILATFLYGRPDAPIPRFIRPQKKRQSIPPPLRYAS